jgi:hypothetical protein
MGLLTVEDTRIRPQALRGGFLHFRCFRVTLVEVIGE